MIFGVRCSSEMRKKAEELGFISTVLRYDREGYENLGFTVAYHGYADQPIWCGVRLDAADDGNDVRLSEIRLVPTEEERAEALSLIEDLPEEIRDLAGEPEVWMIWSGS